MWHDWQHPLEQDLTLENSQATQAMMVDALVEHNLNTTNQAQIYLEQWHADEFGALIDILGLSRRELLGALVDRARLKMASH